ncbi:PREDICTED: MLP-like protein 34 [Tarenaya hassleriana]|uniref:MLP-like protein 34 n=1 Tax=Tarenaya hassleriana TaxID=28532 RepID=UPI00053C1E3C|nr:PREDICTED: MLP-like protein 34 [Tarenaya hassleriana]
MGLPLPMRWKVETEVEIKASAEKFHHMFAGRPHHVSNATPHNIQSCDLHEGEWGKVGSIIFWKYVHDGQERVAKDVIEAVDPDKNMIRFRVIDGDVLKEYKTFLMTIHVTPKEGGEGSVVHWLLEYEKLDDKVAHPETLVQLCAEISKDIDKHLLSEKEKEMGLPMRWKVETEVEIKASAEKFHHMFVGRPHHVSNATPHNVQGCELHEGEWGKVGSIVFWKYVHDGEQKVAKEVIEAVDPDKNMISFRVIDGDIMKEYKTFLITIYVTPKEGGEGSVAHWHLEYEKLDDKVAHPETLVQFCADVSKDIDQHLLSGA